MVFVPWADHGFGAGGMHKPEPGHVEDEARRAGRPASSFPAADEDYYHDMDGGIALSADEIKGRNMWLVWTGGNDRLWDEMTVTSVGTFDLLKTLSSYPGLKASRDNRWNYLGLVNEPCFNKPTGPDADRYGLWLDKRIAILPTGARPTHLRTKRKYPGVADRRTRQDHVPVGSYYGYASGIVGLRMFPNPAFDDSAPRNGTPSAITLTRATTTTRTWCSPYRVGMSCAFCHVGPNPMKPPADSENPKWENLSSNVGAQYFWIDRIFAWDPIPGSFPLPALPHVAAGNARHLAGFDRQHQ